MSNTVTKYAIKDRDGTYLQIDSNGYDDYTTELPNAKLFDTAADALGCVVDIANGGGIGLSQGATIVRVGVTEGSQAVVVSLGEKTPDGVSDIHYAIRGAVSGMLKKVEPGVGFVFDWPREHTRFADQGAAIQAMRALPASTFCGNMEIVAVYNADAPASYTDLGPVE